LQTIHSRLRQWLELQPPDHFLLIEQDEELAQIVLTEMRSVLSFPVESCRIKECKSGLLFAGAVPVALSMKAKSVRDLLPEHAELVTLQLRSAGDSLAPYLPAPSSALIGIASRWRTFLKTARTMLIAAGFHPDSLVLRDASKTNWQRGLKQTVAVICDAVTAQQLDGTTRVLPFPLLARTSLKQLRDYEDFIRTPLVP